MKRFTEQDLKEIAQAVKVAESTTSGEIVPFFTESASNYLEGVIKFLLLMLFLFSGVYLAFSSANLAKELLIWQIISIGLGFLIANLFPRLRIFFTNKEIVSQKTNRRAMAVFHEQGIGNTRDATGILVALFLQERRVEVIADEAINKLISQAELDQVVELIINDAQKGKVKDGFIKGIKKCGQLLSEKFPIKADDTNELNNEIVIE